MVGVIFDLDGTLVDSLGDIAAAMNRSLAAHGFPTHPEASYRAFVGEGVERLVERALPPHAEAARPALLNSYQTDYASHLAVRTVLYPGISALLDGLTERSVPMAVLSNKPDGPTRQLVETLLNRWSFCAVAGARTGVPRKPDPTAALELATALGVPPEGVAFVGDTLVDIFTARAAGMRPLGVLWGFRAEDVAASGVVTVRHPRELLPLLTE